MIRDIYVHQFQPNPLTKFTNSTRCTELEDIFPWNISQMITKTIPINKRIVISYTMKQGTLSNSVSIVCIGVSTPLKNTPPPSLGNPPPSSSVFHQLTPLFSSNPPPGVLSSPPPFFENLIGGSTPQEGVQTLLSHQHDQNFPMNGKPL